MMAPFTGHPYDLGIWMSTGSYIGIGKSPYDLHPHIGYPPLWALWCGVSYLIANFLLPENQFAYIFTIKIPILLADFAIVSLMLQVGLRNRKVTVARILASLYLLNPYVLTVGVVWGMMDNIVAFLSIASILAIERKAAWSGFYLALGFALKFYPILFLPLILASLMSCKRLQEFARCVTTFLATSLAFIWFPFLIFDWDPRSLMGVGLSQASRSPGAIAPVAVWTYLTDIGITSIGPISIESIKSMEILRILWIPALLLTLLLILKKHLSAVQSIIMYECFLLYLIYLLTAPWISEQLFEPALIFMLFQAVVTTRNRFSYTGYALGSAVVYVFLALHVPLTSFIFPLYNIEPTALVQLGKTYLPWLVLAFGSYLMVEIIKTVKLLEGFS